MTKNIKKFKIRIIKDTDIYDIRSDSFQFLFYKKHDSFIDLGNNKELATTEVNMNFEHTSLNLDVDYIKELKCIIDKVVKLLPNPKIVEMNG